MTVFVCIYAILEQYSLFHLFRPQVNDNSSFFTSAIAISEDNRYVVDLLRILTVIELHLNSGFRRKHQSFISLTLPGLGFLENLRGGTTRPLMKEHAISQKVFVSFTWNFVHILFWQYGISLDKKIDKYHFCHHLMMSSWKSCVDVF